MLSKTNLSKIADFFADKPVKRTYLFGSFVRSQEKADSDIDLMIEIDYKNCKVSLLDFIGWKMELENIMHKEVDLVSSDGLSKYMKPYIDKEKKLIYERPSKR